MYTKKVVAARSVMSNAAEADTKEEETVIWSTWEELLLAFAVKRHGLKDWHTVAMELQNRHQRGGGGSLFTAQICKDRYRHLKRRFLGGGTGESDNKYSSSFHSENDDDNDEGMGGSGDGGCRGGGEDNTLPWLEELRKLRVAELKQEVHRYDVSIRSLQIKVKTMEEERENSLRREDPNDDVRQQQRPDLDDVVVKRERSENDKSDDVDKDVPPEKGAGKSASGSAGDENASFNEYSHYSTGNMRASSKTEPENELAEAKSDPEMMPPLSGGGGWREDSCNDSSDRHQVKKAASQEREKDDGEDGSGDFRGSVDESKEATKESSDVQSSASLLTRGRKRRRTETEGGGGFVAAPIKREVGSVKSEPSGVFSILVDKIRSHKRASVFQRRLESQKTDKYKRTIRRHVDLETIQTRIDEGSYFSCSVKFYLDLVLLFTNAIIFFPKASPESLAAQELRRLVMNEMKNSSDHRPNKLQLKPDRGSSDPLLAKHQSTNPVRKRISISAKASPSSSNKVEKQKTEEDRPVTSSKPLAKSPPLSTSNDEEHSEKLKVREKPVTGTRSVRRSVKGGTVIKKPESTPNSSSNNKSSSSHRRRGTKDKVEAGKVDKKKSAAAAVAPPTKKSGAADFLRRMKKNSPAKAMKSSKDNSKGRKKDKEKKKLGETKEAAGTRNAEGGAGKGGRRNAKEKSSPSKRTTIGRSPKKVNDVTVTGSKRGRDDVGEGSSQRAKKRSR